MKADAVPLLDLFEKKMRLEVPLFQRQYVWTLEQQWEPLCLRNQMKRLFGCTVSMIYEDEHGEQFVSSLIAERGEFWWSKPDELSLWDSAGDTWSPNRRGKAADGPLYSSGVQRIGSVGMTVCHPSVFRQARERAWTSVSRIRVTDVMIA